MHAHVNLMSIYWGHTNLTKFGISVWIVFANLRYENLLVLFCRRCFLTNRQFYGCVAHSALKNFMKKVKAKIWQDCQKLGPCSNAKICEKNSEEVSEISCKWALKDSLGWKTEYLPVQERGLVRVRKKSPLLQNPLFCNFIFQDFLMNLL